MAKAAETEVVLDPKRGRAKVENLLQEPVLSAITRQVDFNYTW